MILPDEVADLKLGDQIFSLIERDLLGAPITYRVVGFHRSSAAEDHAVHPYIRSEDDRLLLLKPKLYADFTIDQHHAKKLAAIDYNPNEVHTWRSSMLYNVTIFYSDKIRVTQHQGLTETQANILFQQVLKKDPEASMLKTPIAGSQNGGTHGY